MQEMRRISLDFLNLYPQPVIFAGYSGEHLATEIVLDCKSVLTRWPNATFIGQMQRPCDTAPYQVFVDASADENRQVRYTLTSTDTGCVGEVKFEAIAYDNGPVAKTRVFSFGISETIDPTGNPPAPCPSWAEFLIESLRTVEADTEEVERLTEEVRAMGNAFVPDEEQRKENELARQAAELQREENEAARIEAEAERKEQIKEYVDAAVAAATSDIVAEIAALEGRLVDLEAKVEDDSNLKEHNSDPYAHQNLVVDGNK